MKAKFHPEARLDLREGKEYYRHHSSVAAIAFAHQIDSAIAKIVEAPTRYPEGEHGTRQMVLPGRFPHTIVYLVRDNLIIVVAVAHHSREPGYWRHRV